MNMQTITTTRAETRTISIAAPPAAVLDVIGDGRRLPEWAPAFAEAAEPEGDRWRITSGGASFAVEVRVARAAGTADILSAEDERRGAFLRVLPNGEGAECLFTLFFPPAADEAAVQAQMATVEAELAAVRRLAEAAVAG
jgi:Polyketide cyclase / dehydrase and lipid transport